MAVIKIQLRGAQAAALAAASLAMSIALGAMLIGFAAGRQDLLVWCKDFVLARVGGAGPVRTSLSAAVIVLAVLSLGRVAVFLAGEGLRAMRLRSDIRRRKMEIPGRVLAASSGMGISDAIDVVRDGSPSAFTFGLWRPRIVMTSSLAGSLTLEQLKAVIAHEHRHLRRKDPLRSLLWETFRRAFFFFPAFDDMASFAALRREIRADADAERRAGKRALASALLKIVAPAGAGAAIAPFGHLRTRIQALAAPSASRSFEISLRRIIISAAVALAIVAVNISYVSPVRARDGTLPAKCGDGAAAAMSRINFSPYLRIDLGRPLMSSAVQSAPFAP